MSCVIRRGFGFRFSNEARQRARKYLLSVGYSEQDFKPIVWPEGAVSAHRDHAGKPWEFTTKADIRLRRQLSAKQHLQRIRECGAVRRVPLYVWVFHCPGLGGEIVGAPDIQSVRTAGGLISGLMGGWYTYLIGQGISDALNFRGYAGKTINRLMELFPLVKATTLFDPPDFDEWMLAFVEQYPRGLWCDVPQGKAPLWGEVKGDQVIRITGRAQWPGKASDHAKTNTTRAD